MDWRERLKQALKDNRTNSKSGGSGDQYWDSVIDTIERFAKKNPEAMEEDAVRIVTKEDLKNIAVSWVEKGSVSIAIIDLEEAPFKLRT